MFAVAGAESGDCRRCRIAHRRARVGRKRNGDRQDQRAGRMRSDLRPSADKQTKSYFASVCSGHTIVAAEPNGFPLSRNSLRLGVCKKNLTVPYWHVKGFLQPEQGSADVSKSPAQK